MNKNYTKQTQISSSNKIWNRNEVACTIIDFKEAKGKQSQREFAKQHNVPRTTLQHWLSRKKHWIVL